jgi:hypothetical protein
MMPKPFPPTWLVAPHWRPALAVDRRAHVRAALNRLREREVCRG